MRIWIGPHAAERFVERVRPGLSQKAGSVELARLLAEFGRCCDPPAGVEVRPPRYCVEVSPGVWVIVEPAAGPRLWPRAVTVFTRSSLTPELRAARNKHKSQQRSRKAIRRRLDPDRRRPRPARDLGRSNLGE